MKEHESYGQKHIFTVNTCNLM